MLPVAISRTFVLGVIFMSTLCSANLQSTSAHRLSRRTVDDDIAQHMRIASDHYYNAGGLPEKSIESQKSMSSAAKSMSKAHALEGIISKNPVVTEWHREAAAHYRSVHKLHKDQVQTLTELERVRHHKLSKEHQEHAYHSRQAKIEEANKNFAKKSDMHYHNVDKHRQAVKDHKAAVKRVEQFERVQPFLDKFAPIIPSVKGTNNREIRISTAPLPY